MVRMRPTKKRAFYRIFRISRRYAWWVVIASVLITGAAGYYVRNIPIHGSFLDLLPQNDPLIDNYRHTEESLLQSDYLALLVSLDSPSAMSEKERADRLLSVAQQIKTQLDKDPEFTEVTYTRELAPEIPDQYLVLYRLNKDELAQIEASVESAEKTISGSERTAPLLTTDIVTAYRKVNDAFTKALYSGEATTTLSDQNGIAAVKAQLAGLTSLNTGIIATIDNLGGLSKVTADVREIKKVFAPSAEQIVRKPEPFFSSDHTKLLINVLPRYPSDRGVTYCAHVMTRLQAALSQVDLQKLGVTVGVTGTYAFNTETHLVINSDMLRSTIISSIGVLVILFLGFGSIFYSIVALIPLLMSVVLTMAWAKFAVGGFNLVTTFLPALVLGIGIDYSIHLISRYAEERSKGTSFNRALYLTVWKKGEASLIGALTTAIVFLGLLLARSRALFDMGVITGMGVLLSFVTTLFLLPSLVTLFHFLFRFHHRESVINYAPHLTRFFQFVTGKARAIFVIVLILTFFIAFQAAQTHFVFSSNDLVPRVKSQQVLQNVLRAFGEKSTRIGDYYTFFAKDEKDLTNIVSHLKKSDLVKGIDSALSLLPVNLAQQKKVLDNLNIASYIDQLGIIDRSLSERASAQTQIRTLLAQFGFLQYISAMNGEPQLALSADAIQAQLKTVQNRLNAIDVPVAQKEISALKEELVGLNQSLTDVKDLPPAQTLLRDIVMSLPEGIRARFLAPDGSYIIQARMVRTIYQEGNMQKFNTYAASFADRFFGMPLVAGKLEDYMRRDFLVSTAFAIVMIMIMLWRSMGGWVRALIAASPLILGYVWMLGGMRLLHVDFNFINITISPLLIGIGVDDGIHIIHRYLEERSILPDGAVERAGRMTTMAIIVTSLTTMLVFASLLIARTPGLRLLGVSALLGIGFTLLFSLIFLPAVLHIGGEKRV
ncbi:MAG TPA: hypothetical protein ENH11_06955 [Candidatus Acetothermia bacterium]|nr:hypothetical protein [Candidatus Acetothermia bacterium]